MAKVSARDMKMVSEAAKKMGNINWPNGVAKMVSQLTKKQFPIATSKAFQEMRRFRNPQLADWYFESIEKEVTEFGNSLSEGEKMSVAVVLSDGARIDVTLLGYVNPNMIVVEGVDKIGNKTKLLLPQGSIEVVLTKVKKLA